MDADHIFFQNAPFPLPEEVSCVMDTIYRRECSASACCCRQCKLEIADIVQQEAERLYRFDRHYLIKKGFLELSLERNVVRTEAFVTRHHKVKENFAPSPTVLSAQIVPPCRWIMRRTVANPMPLPGNRDCSCSLLKGVKRS